MNELYHYGILGMKWGVRRYQNEDGTLTEAGKRRYGAYLNPGDTSFRNVARIRQGVKRNENTTKRKQKELKQKD